MNSARDAGEGSSRAGGPGPAGWGESAVFTDSGADRAAFESGRVGDRGQCRLESSVFGAHARSGRAVCVGALRERRRGVAEAMNSGSPPGGGVARPTRRRSHGGWCVAHARM